LSFIGFSGGVTGLVSAYKKEKNIPENKPADTKETVVTTDKLDPTKNLLEQIVFTDKLDELTKRDNIPKYLLESMCSVESNAKLYDDNGNIITSPKGAL